MGRGRGGLHLGGGGGGGGGGLGAPIGFGASPLAQSPDEPKVRHGPVRYSYAREDLVSMLERARCAAGMNGELPHPPGGIDPETVPLKTVRAGDSMYELTVEGAKLGGNARISGNSSREWTQGGGGGGGGGGVLTQGVPAPNAAAAAVGKDVPEWADATATGGPNGAPSAGFLGSGAVPRLTASERSVVFGDSSDRDTAVDRKMATASLQQAAGGFFGLAPGGGGMDDARSSKLIGALESDGENTNLGGGIDVAVDPPLHQRNQQRNQQQNQQQNQGGPPPTGPITDAPWFYLDPSGTSQGPFKRAELLEWHDSGYFPLDLPLRPADAPPSMPFVPLAEMLECGWRYPGPRVAARMRAEHEAQMKQAQAAQAREAQEAAMRARAEAEAAERERAEAARREAAQREEAARQAQMQEMQRQQQMQAQMQMQMQMQQQAQMQQQQQNGLHFGTSPPVPPPQQGGQTLLANLFAGGGGGGGGAPRGPAPGGPARGAVSLADLERSMSQGPGLPMAPAPGSFDGWPNQPPSQTPHSNHAQTHAPHHTHDTPLNVPASTPAKPAWGGASAGPPPGGHEGVKSLAQIQAEEEARAEARRRDEEALRRAQPGNPVVGGVWGGGGGNSGPSLAQIQAEEMRRAEAARADASSRLAPSSETRTSAAAPGSGGVWGGRPSAAVSQPLPGGGGGGGGGGFWDSLPPAATQPPAGQMRPPPPQQRQVSQPRSEFPTLGATAAAAARAAVLPGGVVGGLGGQPGPAQSDAGGPAAPTTKAQFREWCRSEMKALHGSDDTTLVDFLVSLPSAGEVTEYVQLYLGDTARAAAFGKELIRIKRTSPQIMGGLVGGGEFAGVGPSAAGGSGGDGVSGGSGGSRDTAGGPGEHDGWSQQPKKGKKKGK